jgi:hypothetical protein
MPALAEGRNSRLRRGGALPLRVLAAGAGGRAARQGQADSGALASAA